MLKKASTLAVLHFVIAFAVAYAFTGSVWAGGAAAVVEPLLNVLAAMGHEHLWQRYGQNALAATPTTAAIPA